MAGLAVVSDVGMILECTSKSISIMARATI